jgi:two-component system, response regulator YesN
MSATQFDRIKVALGEDEPDQRIALAALLKALNYDVVCTAAHGAELVSYCSKEHVDVVIADLDMPEMDGLEVAEALADRATPVILLSGHADVRAVRIENEPLAARLLKPASADSLRAAIDQVLDARRRRQSAASQMPQDP